MGSRAAVGDEVNHDESSLKDASSRRVSSSNGSRSRGICCHDLYHSQPSPKRPRSQIILNSVVLLSSDDEEGQEGASCKRNKHPTSLEDQLIIELSSSESSSSIHSNCSNYVVADDLESDLESSPIQDSNRHKGGGKKTKMKRKRWAIASAESRKHGRRLSYPGPFLRISIMDKTQQTVCSLSSNSEISNSDSSVYSSDCESYLSTGRNRGRKFGRNHDEKVKSRVSARENHIIFLNSSSDAASASVSH